MVDVLLASAGLGAYAAIPAAVITAFTAYAKFVSPETKLQRYSDTIAGIHRVLLDWRTRTDVEQANVANISELVGDCESLFSAERQAWVSTAMNNTALKDATGDQARPGSDGGGAAAKRGSRSGNAVAPE